MPSPRKATEKNGNAKENPKVGEISLNPPWAQFNQSVQRVVGLNICRTDEEADVSLAFIEERSKVHESYIKETNRTKRFGLGVSAFMLVISGCIFVFAPAGREVASYFIGGFLILTAAGVAGLTAMKLKFPGFRLDARK
ncbi:MAG: hypothetical protein WA231_19275 [Methylocella sp.]